MYPRPTGDGLLPAQRDAVAGLVAFVRANDFDARRIAPSLSALVRRMSSVCAADEDQARMVDELDCWVRWSRLPGLWLSYVFQLSMRELGSSSFVAGCLLYADAQLALNDDLGLSSLENAYKALSSLEGVESAVPVAVDLRRRLRLVIGYYRRWYGAAPASVINPLTEHLCFEKAWREVQAAFPELHRPRAELEPTDYQGVIDRCGAPEDVFCRVMTRQYLGLHHSARSDAVLAEEQLGAALKDAEDAALEPALGHLLRLHGYALRQCGRLDEAAHTFRRAFEHESHPRFAYWQALSARELGDVLLRRAPRAIDLRSPPGELVRAADAYRAGRALFDASIAGGSLPVARAIAQQQLRSYADNAVEVAVVLGRPAEALAEIEASGPRNVTDVMAESRAAAAALDDAGYADFRRARAIFHRDLGAGGGDDEQEDFQRYLDAVASHRVARQLYLTTRARLASRLGAAHRSDATVAALGRLKLPGVMFLLFHVGAQQTFGILVEGATGRALASGAATVSAAEWDACHAEHDRALADAAEEALPVRRAAAVQRALQALLGSYEGLLGKLFEELLPFFAGKHLVVFPRLRMNEVPLSALRVAGKRLIEHCQLSFAQTLGAFLQAREGHDVAADGVLEVIHDAPGTRFYPGTFHHLGSLRPDALRVVDGASWAAPAAAPRAPRALDLLFACHGHYDPEDPAKSRLVLRSRTVGGPPEQGLPFSTLFEELDLRGCRSVVMGACESGLGRTLVSAEFLGLPLAFLAAGARCVVGALWKVDELATAILLAHHFRLLWGGAHTVPAALSEAQRLTMRLSKDEVIAWLREHLPAKAAALEASIGRWDERPFAHPYFWAGLYVLGGV